MKNWREAEKEFAIYFLNKGKKCYLHRLEDTKAIRGRTKGTGFTMAQPADYIVIEDGCMFYAEVKFSQNENSFPFGSIQKSQMNAARRIIAAGGNYYFFIYSTHVGTWFKIPVSVILNHTKKSLRWTEISQLEWRQ